MKNLKAAIRSNMEKHLPRTMLRYRLHKKIGFEEEMRLLPKLCDPGKASLDIGANIGVFAWHLQRHSREVIAFEPNPALADLLENTFRGDVSVQRVALSDRRGSAVLSLSG